MAAIADTDTEAGAVRLVAGSGPHEGRVEVYSICQYMGYCVWLFLRPVGCHCCMPPVGLQHSTVSISGCIWRRQWANLVESRLLPW